MTYVDACIKESLRLSSPIGIFSVQAKEETLLDGKYLIPKGQSIQLNLKGLHHDREVWGEDVDVYRPERFLNGGFQALPPNSWKPFGNGMRACIGRSFAEQEMVINIALVLQRFQIQLADPTYELQLKSTLTIKPMNFRMKVRRRAGKDIMTGIPGGIPSKIAHAQEKEENVSKKDVSDSKLMPMSIFYGGNTGTCEGFAQDLETKASDYGFVATIQSLDSATENLPTDQPVIIITASYEGKPPDNGKNFVSWLEQVKGQDKLKNVNYAVFGVGNSDVRILFKSSFLV